MSRVVVAPAFGGPEVLTLVEQPDGEPGPGEVLLEVRAAGVNPADWKGYGGAWGTDPSRLPMRLGFEAAGVVSAVGEGAEGPAGPLAAGDEVIGFRLTGAYADRLVVPASALVPKPAGLAWEAAAGLMLTGATAVHALTAADVGAGDTVLVHGAAGVRVLGNGPGADPGTGVRDAARGELARLAGEGRLTVVVDATFPLAEVAAAHRRGMAGHSHGKLILVP